MNPFKFFGKAFGVVKGLLEKAFAVVKSAGLDDELIEAALKLVRFADEKFISNSDRREWVVAALVKRGIPENIARIATEFAYRLYKAQKAKIGL